MNGVTLIMNKEWKHKHLYVPDQWREYWSAYPQGYTILEALMDWVNQVNNMSDNLNDFYNRLKYFKDYLDTFKDRFDDSLKDEIQNTLEDWQASGFLDDVISEALQTQIDIVEGKVDSITRTSYSYGIVPGEHDNTLQIQEAIDDLDSQGGGLITFGKGEYVYSNNLYIKEGTRLSFLNGATLICNSNTAEIIFYNDTIVHDLIIEYSEEYFGEALKFDNKYLTNKDKRDTSKENAKVLIDGLKLYKPYVDGSKSIALSFFSSRQSEYTPTAGFWGVNIMNSFIDGFTIVRNYKTTISGWINGNTIDNLTADHFKHFTKVDKSKESLGVDHNICKNLRLQCRNFTRELFDDGNYLNIYRDVVLSDMKTHTDTRLGIGNVQNIVSGQPRQVERYAEYLLSNRYYLLGTFINFTSLVNHVMIRVTAYGNVDTDFFIRGGSSDNSGGSVEIRYRGDSRLSDKIDFYTKKIEGGRVELYAHNTLPQEYEANIYVESFRSFYPASNVYYNNIDGLTKITDIVEQYPSPKGMYTKDNVEAGRWVKYADGTMIIRHRFRSSLKPNKERGSLFVSESEEWIFPEEFATSSTLTVTAETPLNGRWATLTSTPNTKGVRYQIISALSSEIESNIFITAIGSWY